MKGTLPNAFQYFSKAFQWQQDSPKSFNVAITSLTSLRLIIVCRETKSTVEARARWPSNAYPRADWNTNLYRSIGRHDFLNWIVVFDQLSMPSAKLSFDGWIVTTVKWSTRFYVQYNKIPCSVPLICRSRKISITRNAQSMFFLTPTRLLFDALILGFAVFRAMQTRRCRLPSSNRLKKRER